MALKPHLPQTQFSMRAGAATREPALQAQWNQQAVYQQALQRRAGAPPFVLHDGPPYLSAPTIHIGTALNKILKDIVTRYQYQRGFYAPYVPGYDGHGLPIENAVVKTLKGGKNSISPYDLRQRCRAFALENLKGQEAQFKRLGIWGDWENPYLTIDAAYEARQIELFTDMAQAGHVYQGLKPVYWCPHCETALADAEVEYADHTSPSILVAFAATGQWAWDNAQTPPALKAMLSQPTVSLVIWTTTPWTLPGNVALCVHPTLDYVALQLENSLPNGTQVLVVAKALQEAFLQQSGLVGHVVAEFSGAQLQGWQGKHPLIDRTSVVLCGEHVTADSGTGIVHTAPGHGMEDYLAVMAHNQQQPEHVLAVFCPVDAHGKLKDCGVEALEGLFYAKANAAVLALLQQAGYLLHQQDYQHSYPNCWRCHHPVIYRATQQWFVSMANIRQPALKAIHEQVTWIPERGKNRIGTMVENRSDWCISRQRVWGVPIPAYYCGCSDQATLKPEWTAKISEKFAVDSADIWWKIDATSSAHAQYFIQESDCPQCQQPYRPELDIMDVWFDSGVSHTAVVEARHQELGQLPVALYLEGSDQHRGWFQSSLLTSIMLHQNKAPFQRVLTHGFVLDEHGRKMSKSVGNVVDPNTIINQYGADVLRLWVASVDFTNDVRIGGNMMGQLAEIYKKVRNTARFLLGNTHDFSPEQAVPYAQLSLLDQYMLHVWQQTVAEMTAAFDRYEFHQYYQLLQNICGTELSSLYFDIAKDSLYCDALNHPRRRAIQTVLHAILNDLTRVLVPVMPHLAEDIYAHSAPHRSENTENMAVLQSWPQCPPEWNNPAVVQAMAPVLERRQAVNMALEEARQRGVMGRSLDVEISMPPLALPEAITPEILADWFLVSNISISPAATGITVQVSQALRCELCWKHKASVAPAVGIAGEPPLCDRCLDSAPTLSCKE